MRGSGEAGSGSNLCEGRTACRGAAVGVSAWAAVFQPPSALAPLLLAPLPRRTSSPRTCGARPLSSLAAAGARRPAGGARVARNRVAAPAEPDPGFLADPEPDPDPPAASDSEDT